MGYPTPAFSHVCTIGIIADLSNKIQISKPHRTGFEPVRELPIDFESIALTARPPMLMAILSFVVLY